MAGMDDFDMYLREWLKEPQNAAAFLNAALWDGNREIFIPALRNVANAWGSLSLLADLSDIKKTTVYRALSRRGNPDFRQIAAMLDCMGLRLTVAPVASIQ